MNPDVVVNQPKSPSPYQQPEASSAVTGLESLAGVDELIIRQAVDLLEVVSFWECANKYRISNSAQEQVYFAWEESNTCNRICCGAKRGFVLHIQDNQKRDVLTFVREFKFCAGCYWFAESCCKYPVIINDMSGRKLGTVTGKNSFWKLHLGIFDENDKPLYEIWAPCCYFQCVCCRGDINIPVLSVNDNSQVGNIRKIWSGIVKEGITKADTFGISFPMNLLVTHKALMLAAVFIVDFTLFEKNKGNARNT